MIERRIIVPVGPESLWTALTQPQEVEAWFGHQVDWELVPGGTARWTDREGRDTRRGVIDDVVPGRRLSFRWWPASGDGPASVVTYELEPCGEDDSEGTRLTVREAPVLQPPQVSGRNHASGRNQMSGRNQVSERNRDTLAGDSQWTPWDTRAAGLWVRLHGANRVAI